MKKKKGRLGAFSRNGSNGLSLKKKKAKKVASARTINKAISKLSIKKTEKAEVPANNRNKRLYDTVLIDGQTIQRVERLSFKKSKSKVKARADVLTTLRQDHGRGRIEHIMIITDVGPVSKDGVFEETLTLIKRALEDSSVDSVHLGSNVDLAIIDQISILHPSLAGNILLDLEVGVSGTADELIGSLDIDHEQDLGESEASVDDSQDADADLGESEASVEDSFDADELERAERREERLERERELLRGIEQSDNFQANIDRLQVRLAIIQNELGRAKGKEEENEDSEYGDLQREKQLLERILWEEQRAIDENRKEVDSKVRKLKKDIIFQLTGTGRSGGPTEVEKNAIRRFGEIKSESRLQLGGTEGYFIEHTGGKNTLIIEKIERKRVGVNHKLLAVLDSIGGESDNIIINLDQADDAPKLFKQIRNLDKSISSRIIFLDAEGKSINPFTVVKGLKRIPNYLQRKKDKTVRVNPEELGTNTASDVFRAATKGPIGKIGTNHGFVKKPLTIGSQGNATTTNLGLTKRDSDTLTVQPNLIARQVMSYRLDRALGLGVTANEIFAKGEGDEYFGVTATVNGVQVARSGESGTVHHKFNLEDGRILKGLADLQIMDAITGQQDRHVGNFFIDPISGKVTGIDNDMAFSSAKTGPNSFERYPFGGNVLKNNFQVVNGKLVYRGQFMDVETAQKLKDADRNSLKKVLEGSESDSEHLDPAAIELALRRFDAVKELATTLLGGDDPDQRLIDDWGPNVLARMIDPNNAIHNDDELSQKNYVARIHFEYELASRGEHTGLGGPHTIAPDEDFNF